MALSDDVNLDLQSCVARQSRRVLQALASARGWTLDTSRPKGDLVNSIWQRLADTTPFPSLLAALSPEAHATLRALLAAGGQLPQPDFIYRFGVLRPYRPWRKEEPPAPWEHPASPAEELLYAGLIFPVNLGSTKRPVLAVVLPSDYHAQLADLLSPSPVLPLPLSSSQTLVPAVITNLFSFLSFLNRESLAPLHGRWLPPRSVAQLLPFISGLSPLAGVPRSELQSPYLAFLHYLAESAGLVAVTGGALKPTGAAMDWLATTPQDQLAALWTTWTADSAENCARWRRFRLPLSDEDAPPARFAQGCALLAACPPQPSQTLSAYLDALATYEPAFFRPATAYQNWMELDDAGRVAYHKTARAAWRALLTGPLDWFGVVRGDDHSIALTPFGAALLGRGDGVWPEASPAQGLRIETLAPASQDSPPAFTLHWLAPPPPDAPGLNPAQRLNLEGFAQLDPATPGKIVATRDATLAALQAGHSLESLLNLLECGAGALPPLLVGTLYRWAEELEQITLREILILETRDPAILQTLSAQRRIRETLRETLSSRSVRVDASQRDALLRRLIRQGYYPRDETASPLSETPDRLPAISAEDQIIIAAALRVYAELSDALDAHARPPYTLAHAWQSALNLAQRDAAQRYADEVLEALRRVATPEDDYHIPAPTGPLLKQLEQAIADQAAIEMTYYTAGRAHSTHRLIDPLRLEWRHDVAYLIAYCHLRQAERVFRVDRIEDLKRET